MEPPVIWSMYRSRGIVLVGHCPSSGPVQSSPDGQNTIKIAAIDLNLTLIVSKSGVLHGENEADWKWWHESVPLKLQALALENYTIIISSNQGRLTDFDGNEVPEAASFKRKMESVMLALKIPVTLLVACANDINRKPRPGLWPIIPELTGNRGCRIINEQSVIVGDAAGREGDHSDSDSHWASNAGIQFQTPEEFFLGETPKPRGHKFHPEWYLEENGEKEPDLAHLSSTAMVVLVGLPGAGKTTFYRRFIQDHGFERHDARSHDSRQSFINAVDAAMAQGIPVVIDDLNIDVESRKTWLSMALKHQKVADAFFFTTPADLCGHNDTVRALGGPLMDIENRPVHPRLRFLDLIPRLEKPSPDEGFRAVHDVHFKWSGTEQELDIWKKFWW